MSKENTLVTELNPFEPQVTCIRLICLRDEFRLLMVKSAIVHIFSHYEVDPVNTPVLLVFHPKPFLLATKGEISLYFTKIKE
jgi:hypothetical protein